MSADQIVGSPDRPVQLPTTGIHQRFRIVLTTFGSLGDLHPYIGVGLGLKARGHDAVIASSETYRDRITALGLGFASVRPDFVNWKADPELMKKVMSLRGGSEYVVRQLFLPMLHESYADTLAAAQNADLLVSHPLTFCTPLVAETLRLPWASTLLAPLSFFSAYDPPVLPPAQWLAKTRRFGPRLWRPLLKFMKWTIRSWSRPYHLLRSEIGLPPTNLDPMFEGQHSPHLVLAMFSKLLASPQPDWPPATKVSGFPFYDRDETQRGLPPELARFLDSGEPPIVFTLGSSAVLDAGSFFEVSAQVATHLRRRAVLLIGQDERNRLAKLPEGVIACEYAPFSELFPRAAAIVHQGGVGTTGQAMRAGRPMLVMPYAHDQPDNADRVVKLGIARTISRYRYTPECVATEIAQLLSDPRYARRAAEVGECVRNEDGVGAACDALERLAARATQPAKEMI
ncbi:MAG: glycosyltransferase [Planctomycetaceae bacterium]|nr:glycosyltransferase [Planctomycetaceae bacterium]